MRQTIGTRAGWTARAVCGAAALLLTLAPPGVEGLGARASAGEAKRPEACSAPGRAALARPNFVVIMTDDQDAATLQYMPRVRALLADRGVTFNNMFVVNPICCPSQVSM